MRQPKQLPLLSICCITYNHVLYIAEALDGFLMQDTDFEYEIIIGEDNSTDGTKAVIERYIADHPGRITLISRKLNVGSINNHIDTLSKARGQYIALCDGDDFWIDPLKLQKQVDFLERNPNYIMCSHHTRAIDENRQTAYLKATPIAMKFDYKDMLLGKREETRICSIIVRNQHFVQDIGKLGWYHQTFATDLIFKLYVLAESGQKIHVLPDVMACYRCHQGGMWSMIGDKERQLRKLSDFNIIIGNFSIPPSAKRYLFKIYLRQYLRFDLRHFQIIKALNTLAHLL